MKDIVIFGHGGFGREVKMLIDHINQDSPQFNLVGFYDDSIPAAETIHGLPYLGTLKDLMVNEKQLAVAVAIGNPQIRREIILKLSGNCNFPSLIHPSVIIGTDNVTIGQGVIICANSVLTCDIEIGDFTILNLGTTVGHDSVLGEFTSIMPGVNVSGEVVLNGCVYIGTGAKIINQLEVGQNSLIGAGAIVVKDVPENCTVVGNPARVVKKHS